MWGFLKLRHLMDIGRQRWTLIAEDICNRRLSHSVFFGLAQGIPVERGSGVYQQVCLMCWAACSMRCDRARARARVCFVCVCVLCLCVCALFVCVCLRCVPLCVLISPAPSHPSATACRVLTMPLRS